MTHPAAHWIMAHQMGVASEDIRRPTWLRWLIRIRNNNVFTFLWWSTIS